MSEAGAVLATEGAYQHLSGRAAAAYSSMLAGGEAETSRMARWSQTLAATLGRLPTTSGATLGLLAAGGTGVWTDGSLNGPATTLTAAGLAQRDSVLWTGDLPVQGLGTGEYAYRVDATAAARVVAQRFARSRIVLPPGTPSVYVVDGVGTPGLVLAVRDRLVGEQLEYAGARQASHLGQRRSQVLVSDGSADSIAAAQRVAKALGLPTSAVAVDTIGQQLADVMVVVGADWRPSAA